MKRAGRLLSALTAVSILLSGCGMRTVDEMYCLPRRSEKYNNLQAAIDENMGAREYCAPLRGENQQTVQMVDLDGDGQEEYLLFAKGSGERPLQILVFCQDGEDYNLTDTIQTTGSAFDKVEYAQLDGRGGYEIVVGRQVSDQVPRSVSVYTYADGAASQLLTANYARFLTSDLDSDGMAELLILHAGQDDGANGVAELYAFADGLTQRSAEISLSAPVDRIKRVTIGCLEGNQPAVFVTSESGEQAVVTDVCALSRGQLVNLGTGTAVQTLGNYYVYPDDLDEDGILELPELEAMRSPAGADMAVQYRIRWYSLRPSGVAKEKGDTYHNFAGGWYLELPEDLADRYAVVPESLSQEESACAFYLWDKTWEHAEKVMTIYTLTGSAREEAAAQGNRFVLSRSESVICAAELEGASAAYGISPDSVSAAFHLIRTDWKTGET